MLLAFEDFVFDEEQGELWKAGSPLKVDAKLLKLLGFFLRHSGKFVSKQELLDQVWDGRVLSDNILSVSIAKLRKALGHREGEREYIVTIYGRGYRFLPSVTSIQSIATKTSPISRATQGSVGIVPLVGRSSVLQRLDSALERARATIGNICMLIGEPGIGKTRLAQVLEERSIASSMLWAWARCHSMESDPPLWIWTQILREFLQTKLADDIRHVLDERFKELTRFTEEGNWASELSGGASIAGHRAFDGIIQVLKRLSKQRPLVLVLDDLQWADDASLRLLNFLVTEIARWPILILGTLRSTEFNPKDSRNKHLSYVIGHSNCDRIILHRLTETDVNDYVVALFGEVDAKLSRAVLKKSEGNPFFMVELLRPWIHSSRPQPDELGISTLALDIIRQRIRKIDSETLEILLAASVIGRTFDLNILSYLTQREQGTLLDLLDQSLAYDMIITCPEGHQQFSFGHELICEVLYEDLNANERKSWHLRAGEYLEKRRALGAEVATSELAHHFLSALPCGDTSKAVKYAFNAAKEASRFFAYADVYNFLDRAIRALESAENPDLQMLCGLLLFQSLSARGLSDSRYIDYLNQAIKLATENGFGRLLAMAGQQLNQIPGMVALPGAFRVLETAEKMLKEEDKKERAMVLAHLAWTPPICMNAQRVEELLTRAEALAHESGNLSALATVLRGKLYFAGDPEKHTEARAIVDELEQIGRSEPEFWALTSIVIKLFHILSSIQQGDQKALQKSIDEFGEKALKLKVPEVVWHHQRIGIIQRMNAGELDGISDALSNLRKRAEELGFLSSKELCNLDLKVLLSQTTDLQSISADLGDRLRFDESDSQSIWAFKIQSMVEFGLLKEAEVALKKIPVELVFKFPKDLGYLATLAHLAVGSIAIRAMEYVEAEYQLLKPYSQYYVADFSYHCEGSVSYYLGMLARTLGRHREAIIHFKDALKQNAQFNLKSQVVRARYQLARTLTDETTGTDSKKVRALLEEALEDARKLGLQRLLDETKYLLAELSN